MKIGMYRLSMKIFVVSLMKILTSRAQSTLVNPQRLLSNKNDVFIVSTASRGIGLEFTRQLLERSNGKVVSLYRGPNISTHLSELKNQYGDRMYCLPVDLEDQKSIENVGIQIQSFGFISLLLNVAGILGDGQKDPGPERSLESINREWLQKTLDVNLIGHVMLTKELLKYFKSKKPIDNTTTPSKIVNLSARVGSIRDNRLGGWYSYRMSKAALNMFTKTLSIEVKRHNTAVISIHPGSTDTDLSKPFQKNIKTEKLFSVSHSIDQMLNVIWNVTIEDTGKFYAYDGKEIPY